MKNKKKGVIIAVVTVAVLALVAGGVFLAKQGGFNFGQKGDPANKVYVERVSKLIAMNQRVGSSYGGKVETQETLEIKLDSEKKLDEIFVKEGQEVTVGTPLFSYKTDDIKKQIQTAKLELEGFSFTIKDLNSQIADVTKEKNNAPQEQKLEYSIQLQRLSAQLRQAEYDQSAKASEIKTLEKSLEKSQVTSTMNGVIKTINQEEEQRVEQTAFITILQAGDYRVSGTIDEQSFHNGGLTEGQNVIVRSRVDEKKTWSGTIAKIKTDEAEQDKNQEMYGSGSSMTGEGATKYKFYVSLGNSDGMTLGQHVFIEPDFGQGQSEVKTGIWLDRSYIETAEDGTSYIWAASDNDRLVRKEVVLGGFDENTYRQEISSGITEDDRITSFMPGLYEGILCVNSQEEVDYNAPLYNQNTEGETMPEQEGFGDADFVTDEEVIPGEMPAEGTMAAPREGESQNE